MIRLAPPVDDGLVIPEVKWWSRDKHHFLARYIDGFTTAMKAKRWSALNYIDLFAGAGLERIADKDQLEWGSPLIAAQAPAPFTKLHLCERNREKYEALRTRLGQFRSGFDDRCIHGDANEVVSEIVVGIAPKSLTLAFLDPFGLHADYETLEALGRIRADLVLFFPVELDAIRNMRAYYWEDPASRLDAVLGHDSGWRELVAETPAAQIPVRLIELYVKQISKLGFCHFEWEPIPNLGAPLYRLIFCSKSDVGLKIWRRVSSTKPGGQRTLFSD